MKKLKKRKRPEYSKGSELTMNGLLPWVVLKKRWDSPLWFVLQKMFRRIPSYRNTQTGIRNAGVIRLLIFGIAFGILAYELTWWPLSLVLGICGLPLPIRHSKKTLWISEAAKHSAPREQHTQISGSLEFDGRKVSLRVNGKVERSVRPGEEPTSIIVREGHSAHWVGFIPKKDTKNRTIWVRASQGEIATYVGEMGSLPDVLPHWVLEVSNESLSQLSACFAPLAPLTREEMKG